MTMVKHILHQLAIFLGLRSAVDYDRLGKVLLDGSVRKACKEYGAAVDVIDDSTNVFVCDNRCFDKAHEVVINGSSKVIYRPDKPLTKLTYDGQPMPVKKRDVHKYNTLGVCVKHDNCVVEAPVDLEDYPADPPLPPRWPRSFQDSVLNT